MFVSGRGKTRTVKQKTYVSEIQRRIDLVHDIQRRGLVVVQRKDQSQAGQRLLAARKIADVLPRLFRGHHAEQNALGEGI